MRNLTVDIGGRHLRYVRAGTASTHPLIVLECGAYGCAADWAVVQEKLALRGLASLAYDRAGLGYSDAGPKPRDGHAIAHDLEALLAGLNEPGPVVLVGHSMAGILLRVFVARNTERVCGLVLVDAVTSQAVENPVIARAIGRFISVMKLLARGTGLGLMRPAAWIAGDTIGLAGEARAEKKAIFGSGRHMRGATDELSQWIETSAQGRASGPYDPALPIAVVTAGRASSLKALQAAPALASHHGYVDHVAGANHASLLGRRFADPIIAGVEYVLSITSRQAPG